MSKTSHPKDSVELGAGKDALEPQAPELQVSGQQAPVPSAKAAAPERFPSTEPAGEDISDTESEWLEPNASKPHYWRRFLRLCRKHIRLIGLCVLALVVLYVLTKLLSGDFVIWDRLGYRYVVESRQEWLTPYMIQITNMASPVALLVMLVLVAAFAPGKRPGMCAAVNLVLVVILNELLKSMVQRPRPVGFRLIAESGYSFPSGHSMVSMAFFGLLVWMIWRYERDKRMRLLWSIFLSLVIVSVGVSRIYLGVHYASDVIVGFLVSIVWLVFYTSVVAPVFLQKPPNPPLGSKEARRS